MYCYTWLCHLSYPPIICQNDKTQPCNNSVVIRSAESTRSGAVWVYSQLHILTVSCRWQSNMHCQFFLSPPSANVISGKGNYSLITKNFYLPSCGSTCRKREPYCIEFLLFLFPLSLDRKELKREVSIKAIADKEEGDGRDFSAQLPPPNITARTF